LKRKLKGINRVTKLENLLKDKNRTIEKLNETKRNEESIKLLQDKELDAFQKDFAYEKKVEIPWFYYFEINKKLVGRTSRGSESNQTKNQAHD